MHVLLGADSEMKIVEALVKYVFDVLRIASFSFFQFSLRPEPSAWQCIGYAYNHDAD